MTQLRTSDETIAEYRSQIPSEKGTDEIIAAIGHIAKAKGMS